MTEAIISIIPWSLNRGTVIDIKNRYIQYFLDSCPFSWMSFKIRYIDNKNKLIRCIESNRQFFELSEDLHENSYLKYKVESIKENEFVIKNFNISLKEAEEKTLLYRKSSHCFNIFDDFIYRPHLGFDLRKPSKFADCPTRLGRIQSPWKKDCHKHILCITRCDDLSLTH